MTRRRGRQPTEDPAVSGRRTAGGVHVDLVPSCEADRQLGGLFEPPKAEGFLLHLVKDR